MPPACSPAPPSVPEGRLLVGASSLARAPLPSGSLAVALPPPATAVGSPFPSEALSPVSLPPVEGPAVSGLPAASPGIAPHVLFVQGTPLSAAPLPRAGAAPVAVLPLPVGMVRDPSVAQHCDASSSGAGCSAPVSKAVSLPCGLCPPGSSTPTGVPGAPLVVAAAARRPLSRATFVKFIVGLLAPPALAVTATLGRRFPCGRFGVPPSALEPSPYATRRASVACADVAPLPPVSAGVPCPSPPPPVQPHGVVLALRAEPCDAAVPPPAVTIPATSPPLVASSEPGSHGRVVVEDSVRLAASDTEADVDLGPPFQHVQRRNRRPRRGP